MKSDRSLSRIMTPSRALAPILFAVLLSSSHSALGLEPEDVLILQKGPLSLRPQLSLAEVYNNNVFYQAEDEVQDFISIISPGVKLQLGRLEHNYLLVNYTYDHLIYIDNDDLNAGQHLIEIRNNFEAKKFKLEGTDKIQFLSNPLGGVVERAIGPDGQPIAVNSNIDRDSFDDSYTLSYALGEKTGIYGRGNHLSTDYKEQIGLYDMRALTGTLGFGYQAFPKTVFFGEGYYSDTETEGNDPALPPNPQLNSFGGFLGVRGSFTPKLSGLAKVGWEYREFDDGTGSNGDPVVDLALTQQFSEKQSLSLTYSRASTVSIQYSRQTYTADLIGLRFIQALGTSRKWQASASATYGMYDYEASGTTVPASEYDYFRGSVGLFYQIQRWLGASLGYEFEKVSGDSSAVIDYTVNRVTLRVAIGY